MQEILITKYVSADGEEFDSKEACLEYEREISNVKAYKIFAYLSEDGESLQFQGYVLVHVNKHHDLFMKRWMYEKYGNSIDFLHGIYSSNTIVEIWRFDEVELETVEPDKIITKIEEKCLKPLWFKKLS